MSYPALLNVTAPVTHPSIGVANAELGWRLSPVQLILNSPNGYVSALPITAVGYMTPSRRLRVSHAYNLSGPFCHNEETDEIFIQHAVDTHIDIGPYANPYRNLAGRATFSGIGSVTSVAFCDPQCLLLAWNMVLTVQHDYHDPITHRTILFSIDYHFEHLTPACDEWAIYKNGMEMWLHGNLDHRDEVTGRFVVIVANFRVTKPVS